jgi:hypothetical protein
MKERLVAQSKSAGKRNNSGATTEKRARQFLKLSVKQALQ